MISSKFAGQLTNLLKNSYCPVRLSSLSAVRSFSSSESSEFSKVTPDNHDNAPVVPLTPPAELMFIKNTSKVLSNLNTELVPIRQAWIENMYSPNSIKVGLFDLDPKIFSAFPRPDVIQQNHKWQILYKHVDWRCMPTRAEIKGSTRKPWPQKGTGRARHAGRKTPQWIRGGWAHGPRGPKTYFYMLPWSKRVAGLISLLSLKYSQDDIKIVDSFDGFPEDATKAHVEEICQTRGWGPSVLFVDKMQIEDAPDATMAQHFEQAMKDIPHINILPVYGLNVFSMLKHETLVLTVDAVKEIQDRLLFQLNRIDLQNVIKPYKPDNVYRS